MNTCSVIRNVDFRGRIVVPKEARDMLGIAKDSPVQVRMDKDCIVIKKLAAGSVSEGGSDYDAKH